VKESSARGCAAGLGLFSPVFRTTPLVFFGKV
jgi:hypothetical protein